MCTRGWRELFHSCLTSQWGRQPVQLWIEFEPIETFTCSTYVAVLHIYVMHLEHCWEKLSQDVACCRQCGALSVLLHRSDSQCDLNRIWMCFIIFLSFNIACLAHDYHGNLHKAPIVSMHWIVMKGSSRMMVCVQMNGNSLGLWVGWTVHRHQQSDLIWLLTLDLTANRWRKALWQLWVPIDSHQVAICQW